MQVSLNWLKDYLQLSQTPEEISDALTALGLETSFEYTGKSFSEVVLGQVLECRPHENADKLSVCEVDTGDNENYTIVCGASRNATSAPALSAALQRFTASSNPSEARASVRAMIMKFGSRLASSAARILGR